MKNNIIIKNKESAVEVIVSESNLNISDNDLSKNGASGIAFQYYVEFNKKGHIRVSGNDIKQNKKYGIDCVSPLSKVSPAFYWSDFVFLKKNQIVKNQGGSVSASCYLDGKIRKK